MTPPASTARFAELYQEGLAAVLNSLDSAVFACDRTGVIVYRNSQAHRSFAAGDTVESVLSGIQFAGDFPGWHRIVESAGECDTALHWIGIRKRSDESNNVPVVVRYRNFIDGKSGRHLFTIQIDERTEWAETDATEIYRRLAALGKLTAQVAHELNNPLDGILRYLNLASRLASQLPTSKLQSYLDESRTGLTRMVQVVGELLEFSRATDAEFDETDINEAVEHAAKDTMSEEPSTGIVLTVDFQSKSMPTVRGGRLYQVCRNLIKNAIDAMPEGGQLAITTGVANGHVVIRVADTGMGLPKDFSRIFEAFYTTKPTGKGTGLGLAICKDYIEHMGGSLEAAARDGGGAVFTILIPEEMCGPTNRRLSKSDCLDK